MSRLMCDRCLRPEVACICDFIVQVKNEIPIVVLQHPTEVKQSKGTLTLLAQSLTDCRIIVGEDFSNNSELNKILSHYGERAYLLYPHQLSQSIDKLELSKTTRSEHCLILLDATWKKAYRMFMLSINLQKMNKLELPQGIVGNYKIRKTSKDNALSTLEACCHALILLEGLKEAEGNKYHQLLDGFVKFNEFQLSFN
ncbi:MAG: DTW domain-containing protein [Alteromonadaceae bacterium]|nr:DTW domain-containing protein [Alteromonadaceae bacterium]